MANDVQLSDPQREELTQLLRPLSESLAADGGVLSVEGVRDSTLVIRLTLAPDACQDCIVPDEMIEAMVLDRVGSLASPTIASVDVLHGDA